MVRIDLVEESVHLLERHLREPELVEPITELAFVDRAGVVSVPRSEDINNAGHVLRQPLCELLRDGYITLRVQLHVESARLLHRPPAAPLRPAQRPAAPAPGPDLDRARAMFAASRRPVILAGLDLLICNDTGGMHLANAIGTPILAAADGVVISAGYQGGYGNMVKLRHADGTVTLYGHNSAVLVNVGERVMGICAVMASVLLAAQVSIGIGRLR